MGFTDSVDTVLVRTEFRGWKKRKVDKLDIGPNGGMGCSSVG